MKNYIEDRALKIADYILTEKSTVRDTAKVFKVSKSTVHKDLTDRLEKISPSLYTEVRKVLDVNKSQRHIRGGNATKKRYEELSKKL